MTICTQLYQERGSHVVPPLGSLPRVDFGRIICRNNTVSISLPYHRPEFTLRVLLPCQYLS